MRLLFIGILFLAFQLESNAQCCAAGNPVSTNSSVGSGGDGILDISLSNMYSFSDTYYEGSEVSDFKYIDNSYFDFSSLSVIYGISNKLMVSADIGWFHTKNQKFDFGEDGVFKRDVEGLGDAALGLIYQTYQSDDKMFSIFQSAKISLPVGDFDITDGPVLLPIDIQPSSGNYKYNLGITFLKRFESLPKFSLLSVNSLEISQLIETDRTHYKYGNQYNLSIIGIYNFWDDLSGILQFRCNIRDNAMLGSKDSQNKYKYNFVESTGGLVVFFSPQINYDIYNGLKTSLQFNLPVYKDMNGLQLTNSYSASFKISKSFNLFGSQENRLSKSEGAMMSKIYINVDGACGMCKDRIENIVLKYINVSAAEWNVETKILTILYNKERPDVNPIQKDLAKAGHDTETYKATDEAYHKLHECCKYRK